ERKGLQACIEKRDLELAISNVPRLSDQLIQPLVGHRAVALVVNVTSVGIARRLSIEEHAKAHGRSSRCRSHDQMQIAGVKAVRDAPWGLPQRNGPSPSRPLSQPCPLVEREACGERIYSRCIQASTTRGRNV